MGKNKECRSIGSDGESPGRLMSETEKRIFSLCCVIKLQIAVFESRLRTVLLWFGLRVGGGGGGIPAYCWPGCCWETQGDEV